MKINKIQIDFKLNNVGREFATILINEKYVINSRGKLDSNLDNTGSMYSKVDKDGIERSILSRIATLIKLIDEDKIEFEL